MTVFDDFDRTVSGSFGAASSGVVYAAPVLHQSAVDVAAGAGQFENGTTVIDGVSSAVVGFVTGIPPAADFSGSVKLYTDDGVAGRRMTEVSITVAGLRFGWHVSTGSGAFVFLDDGLGGGGTAAFADDFWATYVGPFAVFRFERSAGVARLRVWDENDAEPGTWDLSKSVGTGGFTSEAFAFTSPSWDLPTPQTTAQVSAFEIVGPAVAGLGADWDGDGFGYVGSDDDLTADIASWTVTRGASPEITGGGTPGSMTVILKNRSDDRYNPLHAGAPLAGKLVDGVPLWLGVGSDGTLVSATVRGLFGGRMQDVTPIPGEGTAYAPLVEITAQDCLGWYGRTPVRLPYAEGRSQGALRAALLAAAGETRTALDAEISTLPLSSADGPLLTVLEALNSANGTRHFCDPADTPADWYAYRTRNRQWRLDGTVDASLSVQDDHVTGSGGWRLSADTVINRQKATVTPVVFTPSTATVWEASTLPIEVTAAKPFSVIVEFDDYVSSPVLDTASTGATLSTTLTPFGTSAKVEMSVASGTAVVSALSIEGRLARRAATESFVSDDTTSQADGRGIREGGEITGEFVGTLASARGIASHVTWRYGDPQLRPTMTVENWFPEMFDLDLYHVISVTSPQLSMTSRHFEIVGLTHQGNVAAPTVVHHVVTYVLQECKVQADPGWFILDSSLLGGSDVLAY